MRNIKLIPGVALAFLILIGCSTKQVEKEFLREQNTEPKEEPKMDNPALFLGTTFAQFIQGCHKVGDYQKMLEFTSEETRLKHGDSVLLEHYSKIQFSYPLSLKSIKWDGNKFTMFYNTTIEATHKTIQLQGVIENDSCKLILDFLNLEKPFKGM